MNKEQPKWKEEFDKRTEMPKRYEDIEDSLYDGGKYPENEYELSLTKLLKFIAESIHQARAEERKKTVGKINYILDWVESDKEIADNEEDPKIRINYLRAELGEVQNILLDK